MTLEDVLAAGYLIGRIPEREAHTHEMRHHKDGNEIVTGSSGRQFTRYYTIPSNAGMYYAKTRNEIAFGSKSRFFAPTLSELIKKIELTV